MKTKLIGVAIVVVLASGCISGLITGDSPTETSTNPTTADQTDTYDTTKETASSTSCKSELIVRRVSGEDTNVTGNIVYNYSELSEVQKEQFDSARTGEAKLDGMGDWGGEIQYVSFENSTYRILIEYC